MADGSIMSPPMAPEARAGRRGDAPCLGGDDALSELDKRLLDEFQRDFPLCPRPFQTMATRLGCDEATVLQRLAELEQRGFVSRVGPVLRANTFGASTLAAMAVPDEQLHEVAELVSGYPEVNHNYQREHEFNLWFVVTARDRRAVAHVLADVRRRTGLEVMDLPMTEAFHIDLGFSLW